MWKDPLLSSLPSYARHLVTEVLERSGYPLVVSEETGIGYDSEIRMATPERSFHELAYVPEYCDHRLHFVVNAAFKVLRLWAVPPEERYVPSMEIGRRLPREEEADVRRKVPGMYEPQLRGLSQF